MYRNVSDKQKVLPVNTCKTMAVCPERKNLKLFYYLFGYGALYGKMLL